MRIAGFFTQAGMAHRAKADKALGDAERARNRGDNAAYQAALDEAEKEISLLEDAAREAVRSGEIRFGAKARKSWWN